MKVMNAAKAADFEKLIVAGEPLSKKEQKELAETIDEVQDGTLDPSSIDNNVDEWAE